MTIENLSVLPTILEHLTALPWAMHEPTLIQMSDIIARHVSGVRLSADEIAAATSGRKNRPDSETTYRIEGSAAVIPVMGVIAKYSRQVNGSSQPRGTSIELLTGQLSQAVGDDRAKRIFLHIESPGGSVAGLSDFADAVYAANEVKPVIAFCDDLAASAAYYIGSQASRLYANQTAMVGAIGTYAMTLDSSRAAEDMGLHFVIVRSGQHKGIGETGIPITDANVAELQSSVDKYFSLFRNAVLRGRGPRGLSAESLDEIADGRCYVGSDALDAKLVDGIMTCRQALTSALPRRRSPVSAESIETETETESQLQTASSRSTDLDPAAGQLKTIETEVPGVTPMTDKATPPDKKPDAPAADQVAAERARCSAVTKILAGHPALLVAAVGDASCDETAATAMLVPALRAELAAETAAREAAEATLAEIAASGADPLKVAATDAEGKTPPDADTPDESTYAGFYAAQIAAGKTEPRARINAAKKFPEAHEKWIETQQPK